MSRLTEKVKSTEDYIKLPTKDKQEFINKLGRLDDIEEEIGCPLEVVFKAIYSGIYFYDNYYKDQMMNYIPVLKYNHFECGNKPYIRYLKDYKKTWWLKKDKSE